MTRVAAARISADMELRVHAEARFPLRFAARLVLVSRDSLAERHRATNNGDQGHHLPAGRPFFVVPRGMSRTPQSMASHAR